MQLSLLLSDPLWIFHIDKLFKEKIQKGGGNLLAKRF